MGIFNRKKVEVDDLSLSSSEGWILSNSVAGKVVNADTAMSLTAVQACVRLLSETVATLPLHLYRYEGSNKIKAVENPLYWIMHNEPNPETTSAQFLETMMGHVLLWGNAYAQIIRNRRGEVAQLWVLAPDRMSVNRSSDGKLIYKYSYNSDELQISKGRENREFSREQILHIAGLGFNGITGYSPLTMARNAIGTALATEEYGGKFYENGAAPSGVLEHPGVIKDAKKLRENWTKVYGGSGNAGKVAVLEEGMKYQPISISPQDAQFLETRKFQIDEIARIFRVPPHMIGDLEKSSFSNIEQQSLEFVKYTLDPWLVRWEQALNKALLDEEEKKQYFFKFNVDGLLRGDYQSRMQGYSIGLNNGTYSVNEVRELENLDKLPASEGGDRHMVNGTMVDLKNVGAAYNK